MKDIDFNKYPLPARMRHHTSPNFYFPLSDLKIIPELYPPVYKEIIWKDLFEDGGAPKILDIGCGRGLFLLKLAIDIFPDKNVLGLEVRAWCCDWLRTYIKNENINNCYALHYSVANGLQFLDENSIEEIYYLFPDPWVKKKHLRRRAFNQKFLKEIYRVLKTDGKLFLATDLLEVDCYHKEELTHFEKMNWKAIETQDEWDRPATNKELFCLRENIETYKIIASK